MQSLTVDATKTLVQACIASRLDYCNAVLHGITDNLLQRLQYVQNAAARLVTRTGQCEHITPVLRELHWLPVRRRIKFKITTLVFKELNGLAPPYLVDDCNLVSDDIHRDTDYVQLSPSRVWYQGQGQDSVIDHELRRNHWR